MQPDADIQEALSRAQTHAAGMLRDRLRPPPRLTVSEWADLHRVLPPTSAEPGRWRTSRTPYLREIMDAFSDPLVDWVVFQKAAQVGGSEGLLNTLGYFIDQDPSTILYVQVSDGEAGKFSKERIAPMIRECPVLADKVSSPRARDSGNTIESKEFPGGHLGIVGANAPSKLRARPRRVVLFDDVDGYPASSGTEGDPVELGVKRTSTYWNRKIGLASTPTVKGASRIEQAYEESDQRKYLVPCLHCETYQELQWKRVRWDKSEDGRHLPSSAHYLCASCNLRIEEKHKLQMLLLGRWEAQQPESSVVGFHLSALYSPWFSWAEMAREFLSAKDYPEKLRVFVNTRLAETYEERGEAPDWMRVYERREDYPFGVCPKGVEFLTVGADVQEDWVEASVWGWGWDRESWLIAHVVIDGKVSRPEVRAELTRLLHSTYPAEVGGELPISAFAIDTGYNQTDVAAWAKEVADRRVMLIKGDHWKNWTTMLGTPRKSEVTFRGRKTGLLLWPVGGALIKQETYGYLELPVPEDGEAYPPGYIHLPRAVDRHWVQGLVSEDLKTRMDGKGFPKREWVKVRTRNEPLDCRVYARAAAEREGLGRMTGDRPESTKQRRSPSPDGEGSENRWLDRKTQRRSKGWLK